MTRIYFDNAATTALDNEVFETMKPFFTEKFGNPSSIYSYGRETKMAIENARKSVAKTLNVSPGEIFFTSGGTESTNTALHAAIYDLGCKHMITSPLEHHATLHTLEAFAHRGVADLKFTKITENGHVDLNHLEELLAGNTGKTVVSLMHANNEIGNLLKVKAVGDLCEKYGAVFHCDTVQTVGHYPIDFKAVKIHFANGAAHKFHGPKGIGILYVNEAMKISPFIMGGAQERNMRAGTENTYGIVGFAKALELATAGYEQDSEHVKGLKFYMMDRLRATFPGVGFNGDPEGSSLYTVLNVAFPMTEKSEMLLFNLDMAGVCVSGGSACTSGSTSVSHVIKTLYGQKAEIDIVPLRFSFCKHNTRDEVDRVVEILREMI